MIFQVTSQAQDTAGNKASPFIVVIFYSVWGWTLSDPSIYDVANDKLHGDRCIRVMVGESHWPQTCFLIESPRKPFNEVSFEQIPEGSLRLSHKDSGAVQAKGIMKIYIFSLCWNREITPFIFLSGTDQVFINPFFLPSLLCGSIKSKSLHFFAFPASILILSLMEILVSSLSCTLEPDFLQFSDFSLPIHSLMMEMIMTFCLLSLLCLLES